MAFCCALSSFLFFSQAGLRMMELWASTGLICDPTASSTPMIDQPLHQKIPSLRKLPRLTLVTHATPLERLASPEKLALNGLPVPEIWIKRDDLTHPLLGGSKTRKLEYLLGDAISMEKRRLITFGMWGSNHALATALAAKQFGLLAELHLGPQPITSDVKKKLLAMHALGARLVFHPNRFSLALAIAYTSPFNPLGPSSRDPNTYWIPPGGSHPLGCLGYANALLELIEQTKDKFSRLRVFVPMGTAGTLAGLLVGRWLAQAEDRVEVVGVGIAHGLLSNRGLALRLAERTRTLIRSLATDSELRQSSTPNFNHGLTYLSQYSPPGYGAASPQVHALVTQAEKEMGLHLESTYSAKAFLAMLELLKQEADQAAPRRQPVDGARGNVFWLTYCPHPLDMMIAAHSWNNAHNPHIELPETFHSIFR